MIHLAPPSARAEQSDLTDYQATQRAWFELCRSHLAQADVLQRFENLSYHYAQLYKDHEGCGSQADRVKELETRLETQDQTVEGLTKSNRELQQENQSLVDRATESSIKLSAVEKERDELLGKKQRTTCPDSTAGGSLITEGDRPC